MFWRRDVPRRVTNLVMATCMTTRLAFGTPFLPDIDTIHTVTVEAILPGEHRVTVDFNFTYEVGNRGEPRSFELWLADTVAPEDAEELQQGIMRIGSDRRIVNIMRSILTSADNFILYLQVKPGLCRQLSQLACARFW